MNATSAIAPPFALRPTAKAPVAESLSTAPAAARAKSMAQSAQDVVDAMRMATIKSIQQAGSAGTAVGMAALDAIRAIWEAVMNMIRWLARVFGVNQRQAETPSEAPAQPAQAVSTEADVNASAAELTDTIAAAAELPADQALGFMKALEVAGLCGADSAYLKLIQQPDAIAHAKAPEEMFLVGLHKAQAALDGLNPKLFAAQAGRAEAAAKLADMYSPPLNVEDLVGVLRATRDQVGEDRREQVDALIAADDHLVGMTGHATVIRESMMGVVAAARNAGVPVEAHRELIDQLLGDSWEHRVSEISGAMSAASPDLPAASAADAGAATAIMDGLMSRLSAAKDVPPAATASQTPADPAAAAASFLGDTPPPASSSIASRLRKASEDSLKYLPPGYNDNPGSDDFDSTPKP